MQAVVNKKEIVTTASVEIISPDFARELLSYNTENRRVNTYLVDSYARQMKDGQWPFTGHPIVIGASGRLLDGQHRLLAVIKANTSIQFMVVRGLQNEDAAFDVIDTGKPRSASDVLSSKGYRNPSTIASLAKTIIRYERYGSVALYERISMSQSGAKASGTVTNHDVVEYVESHPELYDKVSIAESLYKRSLNSFFTPNDFGVLYHIFSKIDSESALDFLNTLATGLHLSEDNPIYVFRRRLDLMVKVNNRIVDRRQKIYLCFRAWNDYRTGKKVKAYQYNREATFPDLI